MSWAALAKYAPSVVPFIMNELKGEAKGAIKKHIKLKAEHTHEDGSKSKEEGEFKMSKGKVQETTHKIEHAKTKSPVKHTKIHIKEK